MKVKDLYIAYAIKVDEMKLLTKYVNGKSDHSYFVPSGDILNIDNRKYNIYVKQGEKYINVLNKKAFNELAGYYPKSTVGIPPYGAQTFEEFFAIQLRKNPAILRQEITANDVEKMLDLVQKADIFSKDKSFDKICEIIDNQQTMEM